MKIFRKMKAVAVTLAVVIIMAACSSSAFALDELLGGLAGSSDASALDDILGGFNLESFDINSILSAFSGGDYSGILSSIIASLGDEYAGFTNNEIFVAIGKVVNDMIANGGDISKVDFNSSEFIALIAKYLQNPAETTGGEGESTDTTAPSTQPESTTQPEPATVEPEAQTRPPETAVQPVVTPQVPYYQNTPTTRVNETTTMGSYSIVTHATVTTPELTAQYDVTDENEGDSTKEGITKKMIIGIIILVISAVAVVVVAIFLKRSRE